MSLLALPVDGASSHAPHDPHALHDTRTAHLPHALHDTRLLPWTLAAKSIRVCVRVCRKREFWVRWRSGARRPRPGRSTPSRAREACSLGRPAPGAGR
jgi:hypothetical protein